MLWLFCLILYLSLVLLIPNFFSSTFSAAGYNNLEVAEYLLEHGADVNAQDKGGLIPLHNAASYGVSTDSLAMSRTARDSLKSNTRGTCADDDKEVEMCYSWCLVGIYH